MRTKMKMLSPLRAYSIRYPVRNSRALAGPIQCQTSALKPSESVIQTIVQVAASFVLGLCSFRWKTNRSIASTQSTPELKTIQNQRLVCICKVRAWRLNAGFADLGRELG